MGVDFAKARDIFLDVLESSDTAAQAARLSALCGTDAELREHVERLLAAHAQPASFIEHGAFAATLQSEPPTDLTGTMIGPYKLLQLIGEGGMGTVYMAEQTEPVARRVALKVIKPGMDTRQVIARFEAERQALAMMDHPNIARVLDAGTTDPGRPYFVMELVNGIPVTQFCDEQHLSARERLELFVPICQAVQHAHQKGIIHRDIKPSNILVALYDGRPVPKVIDFGVAKATGGRLTDKTMFTGLGQIVGTIEYMSPEQAQRNQLDIDTRSDVYSLGVVLYELLTGQTPFDKERLRSAALDELLRIIREEEPPKPSTKLSSSDTLPSVAANRNIEPAKLSALVRGELDWIVMKTLEKDRGRRYESASALAADIAHYLNDEPVVACPPSAAYRFRKFARRNRIALATTGFVIVTLIAATAISLSQARRATNAEVLARSHLQAETAARKEARANARKAREVVDQMLTRVAEERLSETPHMQFLTAAFLNDAVTYYQEFTKTSGDDPELRLELAKAWGRLGQAQSWIGKQAEADAAFQRSVALLEQLHGESRTDPAIEKELYGAIYSYAHFLNNRLQDSAKAEPLFERCLAAAPGLKQVYVDDPYVQGAEWYIYSNLSATYLRAGRPDESTKATERAAEASADLRRRFPNHEEPLNAHSEALLNLGVRRRILAQYEQADDCLREAEVLVQLLLEKRPSRPWYREMHAQTLLNRGLAQVELGQLDEAAASYKRAHPVSERLVRDFPDTDTYLLVHEGVVAAQVELGRRRGFESLPPEELRELEEDLRQIAALLEENTADPDLHAERRQRLGTWYLCQVGPFYEAIGKSSESQEARSRALAVLQELAQQSRPHTASFWQRLADAQRQSRQYEAALESATKGIANQGDDFFGRHLRGEIYLALQQYEQAVADLSKALEYDDKHGWTWFHRGWARAHLGEYAPAAEDFRRAIDLEPAIAGFHANLGDVLMQLGEFGEALKSFQNALELEPASEHYKAKVEEVQAKLKSAQ